MQNCQVASTNTTASFSGRCSVWPRVTIGTFFSKARIGTHPGKAVYEVHCRRQRPGNAQVEDDGGDECIREQAAALVKKPANRRDGNERFWRNRSFSKTHASRRPGLLHRRFRFVLPRSSLLFIAMFIMERRRKKYGIHQHAGEFALLPSFGNFRRYPRHVA